MTQNRAAHAYQKHATTILTQPLFCTIGLQDRGLPYKMRPKCVVNVRNPQVQTDVAKKLRLPDAKVAKSLATVIPLFKIVDGFVISPKLGSNREYLAELMRNISKGGKTEGVPNFV